MRGTKVWKNKIRSTRKEVTKCVDQTKCPRSEWLWLKNRGVRVNNNFYLHNLTRKAPKKTHAHCCCNHAHLTKNSDGGLSSFVWVLVDFLPLLGWIRRGKDGGGALRVLWGRGGEWGGTTPPPGRVQSVRRLDQTLPTGESRDHYRQFRFLIAVLFYCSGEGIIDN